MKRLLPLFAAVAALGVAAIVTVVAVGASSGGSDKNARQTEDSSDGSGVAAMCAEDHPDCDDTIVVGEGDDGRCVEGAVDCIDTTGGGSMNMCIAEDNPGADDAIAAAECNDMIDCAAVDGAACDNPMPVDPICVDDGSGRDCVDDGSSSRPLSGPTTTYDLTIVFNETVTQTDVDETIKVITGISPDTEFLVRESFPPVGVATVTTDMASFCPDIEAKLESSSFVGDVTCAVSAAPDDNPPDPDEPVSSEPGE